jgi:hypothetical protein
MSKEQKGNKESKKPKAEGTKKQKKAAKNNNDDFLGSLGSSK